MSIRDVLLARHLTPAEVTARLQRYGFRDAAAADRNLQAMAGEAHLRLLLADVLEDLLSCLSQSADPDQALTFLARFTEAAVDRARLFGHLKEVPRTIELLARTLGASPFMAEILIRHPEHLYWISDPAVLGSARSRPEMRLDLRRALRSLRTEEKKLDLLRVIKRQELLHIGVRDVLRLASVDQTLAALTRLAEVLIQEAYRVAVAATDEDDAGPFTVLALGKLGGGELNFSSDVDLIYVHGPHAPSDRFERLARRLTSALDAVTSEGRLYRVDLRLRPEGRLGPVAASLESFKSYYAFRGATWERLALLKAWPVAGDLALGRRFLRTVAPFVYRSGLDGAGLREIRDIKAAIDRKVGGRGERHRHVKLGFGGIREIELVTQVLQVRFGARHPEIRRRQTLPALRALARQRLLPHAQSEALVRAYRFLRDVENKLQMVEDAQVHALPADEEELERCARRLGYGTAAGTARQALLDDYRAHTSAVNEVFRSIFDD